MVLRAAHGEVDPLLVLDPGIDPVLDPFAADPARSVAADALFESFVLAVAEPLDRARLEGALREWPQSVARIKGIVMLAGEGPTVVQRVGRRWSLEPAPAAFAMGRLVVIGLRGAIDHRRLLEDLMTAERL